MPGPFCTFSNVDFSQNGKDDPDYVDIYIESFLANEDKEETETEQVHISLGAFQNLDLIATRDKNGEPIAIGSTGPAGVGDRLNSFTLVKGSWLEPDLWGGAVGAKAGAEAYQMDFDWRWPAYQRE